MVLLHRAVRVAHGDKVITTRIASSASDADEAIAILMHPASRSARCNPKLVGLDVNKVYERSSPAGTVTGKVASLTLCKSDVCVIFRLLKFDVIPRSLFALLELPDVYFCSAGMRNCMDSLRRDFGFVCRNAINVDFPTHTACNGCFKEDLQSGVSTALSDWGAAELSVEQVNYAAYYAYLYWHIPQPHFGTYSGRYDRCIRNLD